ncbi:hypothetical protein GCM10027456_20060 [Kineosporia babensis]
MASMMLRGRGQNLTANPATSVSGVIGLLDVAGLMISGACRLNRASRLPMQIAMAAGARGGGRR